ncbi:hypothetical protein LPJ61_003597, partial [Coemansia biformis]
PARRKQNARPDGIRPTPDTAKGGPAPRIEPRSPVNPKGKRPEHPNEHPNDRPVQMPKGRPKDPARPKERPRPPPPFSMPPQQQQQQQLKERQQEIPKQRPRPKAPATGSATASATGASTPERPKQKRPVKPKPQQLKPGEPKQPKTGDPILRHRPSDPPPAVAVVGPAAEALELPPVDLAPPTKVCIRWLPPDLPEHVFWRAAEPALPWFDASGVGSVMQRECEVPETESVACGLQTDADAGSEADRDNQSTPADAGADISPHGPTRRCAASVYESANIARLDSKPYWRRFVPGKQHRSKKPLEPSRAYIMFASPGEADHFYQRFHSHMFGKDGVNTRAVVELALFQGVPQEAQPDPLEGTIDADVDFRRFLGMDVAQQPALAAAGDRVPAMSYAAAAGAGDDDVTPLIRHLRELKGTQGASAARGKGVQTQTAPASPARTAKPNSPRAPKAAALKKQRRPN